MAVGNNITNHGSQKWYNYLMCVSCNQLCEWAYGITNYGSHKWHNGGGGGGVTNYGSGRKDVVNRCLEFGPIIVSRLSIVAHQRRFLIIQLPHTQSSHHAQGYTETC